MAKRPQRLARKVHPRQQTDQRLCRRIRVLYHFGTKKPHIPLGMGWGFKVGIGNLWEHKLCTSRGVATTGERDADAEGQVALTGKKGLWARWPLADMADKRMRNLLSRSRAGQAIRRPGFLPAYGAHPKPQKKPNLGSWAVRSR